MKIKLWIALLFLNLPQLCWALDCQQEKEAFAEAHSYFSAGQYLLASSSSAQVKNFGDEACGLKGHAAYFQTASFYLLSDVDAFELSLNRSLSAAKTKDEQEKLALLRSYAYDNENVLGGDKDLLTRWQVWRSRGQWDFKQKLALTDLTEKNEIEKLNGEFMMKRTTKSPWVAGTLSAILPGAGQAYIGAYESAALAFIFNALLLGTTMEFHRHKQGMAAATSGVLFSMTYIGNIVSAAQGAHGINTANSEGFEKELRIKLLPELEF